MQSIRAVFFREWKIRFTNLIWVFWDLFYPLGYMLVFGVGIHYTMGGRILPGGQDYNAFFLAGVLGMASFGIASNSSWAFFMDRDNGIFYEMLTYPMSRSQLLIGKLAFNLFMALVQGLITVGLAWFLLGVPLRFDRSPLLLLGLVGGTAGWFFFYTVFALRIRRNDMFNTVNSVFYFVFLFASSMFYPLDSLPAWFRTTAQLNPITWHVDVLRYSTIGLGDPLWIGVEALGLALFSLSAFWLAVRSLQREA